MVNTGGGQLQWSHQATGAFYTAYRDGDRLRLRLTGAAGRHQGAVTVSSNAGQTVVPVSADVVARPRPAPQPQPVRHQAPPRPQPQPRPQPWPARARPAPSTRGRSRPDLRDRRLVLSLFCGLGLVSGPWVLVMAHRADRRIRASGGWLDGAAKVRTARTLAWVAIGVSIVWWTLAAANAAVAA